MSSFWDKKQRVMQERLFRQLKADPTHPLDVYRQFVQGENRRIQRAHQQGAEGRATAHEKSLVMEILLKQLWTEAFSPLESSKKNRPPLALMALGGFGRNELNPFSDVDVMFLHDFNRLSKEKEIQISIEHILYMLWDMGLKVGHATRTITETCEIANENLQSKTALLDFRCIAGDEKLCQNFNKQFFAKCITGREEEYVAWRLEDQMLRHEQQGGSVFMQEPHIKQGCGGLRDYHHLLWVSHFLKGFQSTDDLVRANFLTKEEHKPLERAYDFLMRTRNELHFLSGRLNDKMTLPIQSQVATGLGYDQRPPIRRVEAFMRDYYRAAQTIFFLTNASARRLAESVGKRKKWWSFRAFSHTRTRTERVEGFTIRGNEILCESEKLFQDEPIKMVKVFLIAQQRNLALSDDLLRLIRRKVPRLGRRLAYTRSVHEMLFEILSHKGQVGRILRLMHQCELLGKLVPEFAPLTCLVQHEFFHRYSADEHTLMCIEQLDALMNMEQLKGVEPYQKLLKSIEDPMVLYLALVLHDTGKSQLNKDHSEVSALNAVRVAKRMKLSPDRLRTLAFLTDHHLTLSEIAQRRNIEELETIVDFSKIVETEERLDYLMLLTYADGRGTTGGVGWSDWKEGLIWQLYENTKAQLSGSPEFEKRWQEKAAQLRNASHAKCFQNSGSKRN
ncbi:MAG: [protein-PII] uridylyltransferase [Verrucomicrobiia bacterium]